MFGTRPDNIDAELSTVSSDGCQKSCADQMIPDRDEMTSVETRVPLP